MECQTFSAMMIGPRHRQEDCILDGAAVFQADLLRRQNRFCASRLFLAVCDGMGGHQGGEAASRFVCDRVLKTAWPGEISGRQVHRILVDIQSEAEQRLPARSGTTIAGLVADGRRAVIFNAGDSRVYKIGKKSMEYLSHDHSLVQDLIDQCMIRTENAALHPFKHLIDFGIGPAFSHVWAVRNLHITEQEMEAAGTYLLCTDGLTDIFSDREIFELLAPAPLENGARLANAARKKGLTDNTSFIIARIRL